MGRRLFAIAFAATVVACSAFGAEPSGKSSSGDPPAPPPPPGSSSGGPDDSGSALDGGGSATDGSLADAGGGAGSCIAVTGYCIVGVSTCCGGGTCTKSNGAAQAHCCMGDGLPCATAADCCIPSSKSAVSCTGGQCFQTPL